MPSNFRTDRALSEGQLDIVVQNVSVVLVKPEISAKPCETFP